jgi:anti-sigma factor RsiW
MLQRDQFELLSAYLDGEVTAVERRQVEDLLSHDEQTKQLYGRLLKLRGGFQGLPLAVAQPLDQTVDQVMARLAKPRVSRRAWVIGGGAIAAAAIGAMSGLLGPQPRLGYQFALQEPAEVEAVASSSPQDGLESEVAGGAVAPTRVSYSSTATNSAALEAGAGVAADALMIALDQPIIDMEPDEEATPIPAPDQGVN